MPRPRVSETSPERIVNRKDAAAKKGKTPVAVVTTKRVVVSGKMPRKMPKAAAVREDLRKKENKARSKMVDDEAEEEEEEAEEKPKKRAASSDDEDEAEEKAAKPSSKRARVSEEPVSRKKAAPATVSKKNKASKGKGGDDDEDGEATADEGEVKKERAKPRFKKHTMHVREMKFLQELPNEKLLKSKTAHRRARRVADGDYRFTRDAVARISEIAVGMCKLDVCRARAINQAVSVMDGTGLSNPGPLRASALSMAHLLAPH
jgi:hypothetical protein